MDIVITLPASLPWSDTEILLNGGEDGQTNMKIKLDKRPKNFKSGERCYIAHNNLIRGYIIVDHFKLTGNIDTSRPFPKIYHGIKYTAWYQLDKPIFIKGFRGFRYMNDQLKKSFTFYRLKRFYADLIEGTEGQFVDEYRDPNETHWIVLYFGRNLSDQTLMKTIPADCLEPV